MSTKTRPVERTIEHLDFTPKCNRELLLRIPRGWLPIHRCRRAAKWMALMPCGHESFSCHRHREYDRLDVECGTCGRIFAPSGAWRWVRL